MCAQTDESKNPVRLAFHKKLQRINSVIVLVVNSEAARPFNQSINKWPRMPVAVAVEKMHLGRRGEREFAVLRSKIIGSKKAGTNRYHVDQRQWNNCPPDFASADYHGSTRILGSAANSSTSERNVPAKR